MTITQDCAEESFGETELRVADLEGAGRNTPKRNLDFSNLCSETSMSRIWANYSACSISHPDNLKLHLLISFQFCIEMWCQTFRSTPTG